MNVVYMIQNSADLHKLVFVLFSHLKSSLSLGFSPNTNVLYIYSYLYLYIYTCIYITISTL